MSRPMAWSRSPRPLTTKARSSSALLTLGLVALERGGDGVEEVVDLVRVDAGDDGTEPVEQLAEVDDVGGLGDLVAVGRAPRGASPGNRYR